MQVTVDVRLGNYQLIGSVTDRVVGLEHEFGNLFQEDSTASNEGFTPRQSEIKTIPSIMYVHRNA